MSNSLKNRNKPGDMVGGLSRRTMTNILERIRLYPGSLTVEQIPAKYWYPIYPGATSIDKFVDELGGGLVLTAVYSEGTYASVDGKHQFKTGFKFMSAREKKKIKRRLKFEGSQHASK